MSEPLTLAQRRLRASAAALTRWSREPDRTAATRPAVSGFLARFERQVDPDGLLDPAERVRRAEVARKAYMMLLALKSGRSR
jgi:hypothetical protein